ncbi:MULTISPECIES: hypothetical protein [unclassified Arenibacter]|jgi:hypothetical protein|uniref:hypothetical protein n=1 Tax=unclassified Arenibacter TaxID=2615047 RepID=UPI000E357AA8|nr:MULTISPECIES: hypothetical protein [unclassified Arenibacter]MCM4164323.1 hypothetical protein [Arenibacter sp. A80]RFT56104.1 hypothetical protein D0S24_12030 [Arenibacter sp. P308M17]
MLLNVSYNNKEITKKLDEAVGRPFTLRERMALDGIGSPKLYIVDSSIEIQNLLILDNNINTCTIELRPKGIIIRFRALLETFGLVVPYYKFTLYKTDFGLYTIYRDQYFIKIKSDTKAVQKFFTKLLGHRADNAPTNIEDI